MKPSTPITTRKGITTNCTARVLMKSLTWTTISIKPTTIIAAWTIIIVRVDVCIALVISYWLWLAIGDAFTRFCYLGLACWLLCYDNSLDVVGLDCCCLVRVGVQIVDIVTVIDFIIVVRIDDDIVLLPQSYILLCNQHCALLLLILLILLVVIITRNYDDIIRILLLTCIKMSFFYNDNLLLVDLCYTVLMIYWLESPYLSHR